MNKRSRFFALASFLLTAIIACCLSYSVQGSFNMSDELHGNLALTLLLCALLQAILFWGARSAARKPVGYGIFVVVCVIICGAAVIASPAGNPIADIPQNAFTGMAVVCAVNLAAHALSRSHATSIALFGAGAFTCGLVQFLYTTNALVAALVFIIASLMLIALHSNKGLFDADGAASNADGTDNTGSAAGNALRRKGIGLGVFMPLVACLLSCVVVLGVIMPLNPPHASVKIFTIYLAYEETNVKTGVELDNNADASASSSSIDESLSQRTTTDKKIDANAKQVIKNAADNSGEAKDYLSQDYSDLDISGGIEGLKSLALNPSIPWPLIIALVLALLVLLLTLPRYLLHCKRLARIQERDAAAQVRILYAFFLSRFKKLGLGKPPELSPVEYANLYRQRIYPYAGAQEACSFDHLTALFVWTGFGGTQPTEEDLQCMYALYWDFYRKCRKELGIFKYTFKHMTL